MRNENNIPENLENEAPFFSKMTKKNHFSAPKNYFEELPEIVNNKHLNTKSLQFNFDKLSWSILAPFTVIAIIFTIVMNWNTIDKESALTNDQLSEYIINEDHVDFDDETVYEAYVEFIETEQNEESDTEEYITYLMENDIDINSIIEEL